MKLSKIQYETLEKMKDEKEHIAYGLRVTMNTLYALLKRNLIERTNLGRMTWLGWERTIYEFRITEKGKEEVK